MTKDRSIRAFKCPSCGAPQEPEAGTLTMKCTYCGGTIIIPESLRTPAPSRGATMNDVFSFGLNGVDLNKIVGNAMQLPHAISLAQRGRLDEAANIYSQITGMEHADAIQAVKSLAAGRAVSLTPGREGATWSKFRTNYAGRNVEADTGAFDTGGAKRSCVAIFGIVAVIAILIAGLGVGAFFMFSGNETIGSLAPAGMASKALVFGAGGIGEGMFKDPRAIGVDGEGNIVVADYEDGRVQTFSPNGEFISGFSLRPEGEKVYVTGLAVDRDGAIYVAHTGNIQVFDPAGKLRTEIGDDEHRYASVAVGGDGKLYATSDHETIVRFGDDLQIELEIPDTFTAMTGELDISTNLAADGLGNMYIVGSFHYLVLKYSRQGTFVDQFGGQAQGGDIAEPGKFTSPRALAVDGYGRVFVADFFDIKVFDESGNFLSRIAVNDGVPFGITVDRNNDVYVITNENHVIKYDVKPPAEN